MDTYCALVSHVVRAAASAGKAVRRASCGGNPTNAFLQILATYLGPLVVRRARTSLFIPLEHSEQNTPPDQNRKKAALNSMTQRQKPNYAVLEVLAVSVGLYGYAHAGIRSITAAGGPRS